MAAITAVSDLTKSTKFTLFTLTIWKPSIAEKIFKLKLLKKKSIFFFGNSQCGRTMRKRHRNCECTSISAWFIDTYGWMYANAKAKQLLPWPLMSCAELTCLTGDSHKSDILQIRLLPTCNKKIKLQISPNSRQIRFQRFGQGDTQGGTSTLEGAMSISSAGPCRNGKFFERLFHWTISSAYLASSQAW